MPVKLFILGRPGSGKSHAARSFELDVRLRDGSFFHINDFEFLQRQFFFDVNHVRFEPLGDKGFTVRDSAVLDEVLVDVEREARQCYKSGQYDLIIIEFARPAYRDALRKFGRDFLQDAYFLYIHTELPVCFQRILLRAANPRTKDDTFISEDALNFFYHEDNRHYMLYDLAADFGLQEEQVMCINNMGSVIDFDTCLTLFFQRFEDRIGTSLETDPLQCIPAAVFEYVASK
ncbi:MAG TPA: hypothetical protein VJO32_00735 [Ktedonobacteraceae bacterium]|nr:hypothetical protein [Ktedonobacteraceae bacterium]